MKKSLILLLLLKMTITLASSETIIFSGDKFNGNKIKHVSAMMAIKSNDKVKVNVRITSRRFPHRFCHLGGSYPQNCKVSILAENVEGLKYNEATNEVTLNKTVCGFVKRRLIFGRKIVQNGNCEITVVRKDRFFTVKLINNEYEI